MEVNNIKVYDLYESIVASGFPMLEKFDKSNFENGVIYLSNDKVQTNKHFLRAVKLANTPMGSGHSNFLTGITVSFNVTGSQVWWMQFQRYHFAQIVSSMSKMHRIRKMLGDKECEGKTDEELIYSCPLSFELTARVTTNYCQLRTIYHQRKHHKLKEWHDFCAMIETLPFAKELITGEA